MSNKFNDLIVYEIYPTSFYDSNSDGIGDLKGIEIKLDYIKEMGFNAIWINPFFTSPFKDGGYDIKDFKNVDPKFGTLNDFDCLIKKAHLLGIKVILDLVAGHTSNEHPYFLESIKEERNEYSDLYIWTDNVWNNNPKYYLITGMYPRNGAYYVNFFGMQPALNYGFNKIDDPSWQMSYKDERTFKAREFLLDVMRFWLKRGADGFRVDMASSLVKNDIENEGSIEIWHYLFNRIKKEYPDSFFVSEWGNPKYSLKAGFDADFILPQNGVSFYKYMTRSLDIDSKYKTNELVYTGCDLNDFINDLNYYYSPSKEYGGKISLITGNHDIPRISNELDRQKLKNFYMFQFVMDNIPFIYQGDEIEMVNSKVSFKDGGYARTGCRTPMQWDNSKNMGFSTTDKELYLPVGKANLNNVFDSKNDADSIYNFIKKLIKIRKSYKELTKDNNCSYKIENDVFILNRDNIQFILNLSNKDIDISNKKVIISNTKDNKKIATFEGAIVE